MSSAYGNKLFMCYLPDFLTIFFPVKLFLLIFETVCIFSCLSVSLIVNYFAPTDSLSLINKIICWDTGT